MLGFFQDDHEAVYSMDEAIAAYSHGPDSRATSALTIDYPTPPRTPRTLPCKI